MKKKEACHLPKGHPTHHKELVKLKRIKGQLEGVISMIEDERYCPDILIQVKALAQAAKAVERSILQTHLEHCVSHAIKSKSADDISLKITEITEIIKKFK